MQVDTQRNRITATAALKKAEPLADQGMNIPLSQADESLTSICCKFSQSCLCDDYAAANSFSLIYTLMII